MKNTPKKSGRGRKQLDYELRHDAMQMAKEIVEKYPKIFFNLVKDTDKIIILGIKNPPPEGKNWLARIRPISGIFKTIAEMNGINTKFVIEVYNEDWFNMSLAERTWIIFHELYHVVDISVTKMFKHDIQDFAVILGVIGINGYSNKDLPNLIEQEIKFSEPYVEARAAFITEYLEKQEEKK